MGNLTRHGENNILVNSVDRTMFGAYMDSAGNKHLVLKKHGLDITVAGSEFDAKVLKPYAGEPVTFELAQGSGLDALLANGKELSIMVSNRPKFSGEFSLLDGMVWNDTISSNPSILVAPYNVAKLGDSALVDIAMQTYKRKGRKYDVKVVSSDATTVYDSATATDATTPVASKTGMKLVVTAKSNYYPIAYGGSNVQDAGNVFALPVYDPLVFTLTKGGVLPTGDPGTMGRLFLNKEWYAFDTPVLPLPDTSYARISIKYVVNPYHYAQHGAGQSGAQWSRINIWFPDAAIHQAAFWDKTKEVLATTNATTKAMLMADVMVPDGTTPAPSDFGTFLDYVLNPKWSEGDGTIAATANEPNDAGTQNIY